MLKDEFEPSELLFRSVHEKQVDVNGDFSSATFKDSFGCSVDRQGGRSVDDSGKSILSKFPASGSIIYLSAQGCINSGAKPKYDPDVPNNLFHSLIVDSNGNFPIKNNYIAKKLKEASTVWYKQKK